MTDERTVFIFLWTQLHLNLKYVIIGYNSFQFITDVSISELETLAHEYMSDLMKETFCLFLCPLPYSNVQ